MGFIEFLFLCFVVCALAWFALGLLGHDVMIPRIFGKG